MSENEEVLMNKHDSFTERYFKPLINLTKKISLLKKDQQEDLRTKLQQAGMNQTPEVFIASKFIYSTLIAIFFLVIFLLNHNKMLLLFAAISAVYMYMMPNNLLKKNIAYANAMRRLELPDFLTPLGKLMYSYTPYQAVKECEKFAGPFLRPYAKKLVSDMDIYPGSIKPFQNFSNDIGVPQAQTFVVAIQQAMNTDPKNSRNILEKQVEVMQRLREESFNELINRKPLAINKYNALMLLNLSLVPMSLLVFTIYDIFSSMY